MKLSVTWKPKANNFWLGTLNIPMTVALKTFDGTYHDDDIRDIGYVCKLNDKFVVRLYGSVYSGSHPVEGCQFDTKEEAMECAERFAIAALIAKKLSH